MKIDEDQEYPLTNYTTNQKRRRAIDSDHFTLFLELSLLFCKRKEQRTELFNFRNTECQNVFREKTTNTTEFSEVFRNDLPLQEQAKKWEKTLNSFFHQSFRKIRVTNKPRESPISQLIKRRNSLKKELNQIIKDAKENEAIEKEL